MLINRENENDSSLLSLKSLYCDYKFLISQKYMKIVVLFVGLFNLLLLVPDLILIEGASKIISLIIIRVIFSFSLFGVFLRKKQIKTFKMFSITVTAFEIIYLIVFLFVLSRYSQPDFLIQAFGIVIIIIVVFIVPNRWMNMLFVSLLGTIGFLVCSLVVIEKIEAKYFYSAIVNLPAVIILCAVFAWKNEQHYYKEFVAKSELERIGSIDCLTNTVNRYKMKEEADRWIDFCHRHHMSLSLIFIDVDDLKLINDKFGHIVGDCILVEISNLIKSQLSDSDILARWGGDEFVLMLPDKNRDDVVVLVEKIRSSLIDNVFTEGICVTCSFGIATMKKESTFENLLYKADHLMYVSKKSGKNKIQCE